MQFELFSVFLFDTRISAQLFLYAGVLLLGCSATLQYFLYLRLRDTGRNYVFFNLLAQLLADYLRVRKQYKWSPWPAYLVWPTAIAGFVFLVIGATKL